MKRKDFIEAVLDAVEVPYYRRPLSVFTDKLTDGTKVLRLKRVNNPTTYSFQECQDKIANLLKGYTNIKGVQVRTSRDGYLNFVIQINYTGDLPDLNKKPEQAIETKEENTASPAYKVTELPGGMFKVETPFGVGFASDKTDLDKMMFWLQGVQAGMQMSNDTVDDDESFERDIDPKEEFVIDLKDIDVTEKRPAEWWNEAQDIMDRYMTSYGQYFDSYEEMFELANEVFGEVY